MSFTRNSGSVPPPLPSILNDDTSMDTSMTVASYGNNNTMRRMSVRERLNMSQLDSPSAASSADYDDEIVFKRTDHSVSGQTTGVLQVQRNSPRPNTLLNSPSCSSDDDNCPIQLARIAEKDNCACRDEVVAVEVKTDQMQHSRQPVNASGVKIYDHQGLVRSSVEYRLFEMGYISLEKIHTTNASGEKAAQFIKVITPGGQCLYVELDQPGQVVVRPNDRTVIRTHNATSIPHSVKVGSLDCVNNAAAGILFECSNGICKLNKSHRSMQPVEHNFIIAEKVNERYGTFGDSPIAYLIVKYSDICTNSVQIHMQVEKCSQQLQQAAFNRCSKDLAEFDQCLLQTRKSYLQYCAVQSRQYKKLIALIQKLRHENMQYFRKIHQASLTGCPSRLKELVNSKEFKVRHKLILYNIAHRTRQLHELLRICQRIRACHDKIRSAPDCICEMQKLVEREYCNLDGMVKPNESSAANIIMELECDWTEVKFYEMMTSNK